MSDKSPLDPVYLERLIKDARSMYQGWLNAQLKAAQENADEVK